MLFYARFTLGSRRPRQPRFRPLWRKRDGRGATQGVGIDKLGRLPDFKTVKKFATSVTVRIRNLAGRSKNGWTQQNVRKRDSAYKPQRNFEAVRSGTGSMFLWLFDYFDGGHFENRSLAIYSLSIKR